MNYIHFDSEDRTVIIRQWVKKNWLTQHQLAQLICLWLKLKASCKQVDAIIER